MPLYQQEIRTILENHGLIRFDSTVAPGLPLITQGIDDQVVDLNYSRLRLVVTPMTNTITMTRVANEATDYNAIDVRTVDAKAIVGIVGTPGYVYTGNFSGCVYYLYKVGADQISGVHAYNGSQPVTKKNFFGKKKTVQVVREFGPTDYYTRHQARMLCRYPTRGELDVTTGEQSLSFLSCVERTSATTYLFAVQGTPLGYRVVRLIRTYHLSIQ